MHQEIGEKCLKAISGFRRNKGGFLCWTNARRLSLVKQAIINSKDEKVGGQTLERYPWRWYIV